jgi:antitoxin component YwqK of YwqJK toxin-antitoxin module
MKKPKAKEHIQRHKDGSLWARGQTIDGKATGYWEWFRKDGTRLRSGYFELGEQVGEWTTYDKRGEVYKVTNMTPKTRAPTNKKQSGRSKA